MHSCYPQKSGQATMLKAAGARAATSARITHAKQPFARSAASNHQAYGNRQTSLNNKTKMLPRQTPFSTTKKHRIYFKKYLLRLKGTIDELRTARPRIHPPFIQQPGRMEQHWLESGLHGRLAEDEPTSRVPTGRATNGLEPTNPHQTSPP